MFAAPDSWRHVISRIGESYSASSTREEALARDAEAMFDAVHDELVDQHLAAAAHSGASR